MSQREHSCRLGIDIIQKNDGRVVVTQDKPAKFFWVKLSVVVQPNDAIAKEQNARALDRTA